MDQELLLRPPSSDAAFPSRTSDQQCHLWRTRSDRSRAAIFDTQDLEIASIPLVFAVVLLLTREEDEGDDEVEGDGE